MRTLCCVIVGMIAALCYPCSAHAQALYTPDPAPLERPTPLKTLKSGDTAKICDAIAKAVTDNGFKLANQDCDVGEFEATKNTNSSGEFDEVLIWLEHDFEKPKDATKIYFEYGRFEKLAGHSEPVASRLRPRTRSETSARLRTL